ncbi:MAG: efflux RND transporter periplasmic adaptor subunit [Xanthobacteraceae bacterium]
MRRLAFALSCLGILAALAPPARSADSLTIAPVVVADDKAVFATVESARVVPARARIGGTVAELSVKDGDHVERGQLLATVGDEKLVLQLTSLDAQIAGLDAQLTQAQTDFSRIEGLVERGTLPRTRLDEARTTLNVAQNAYRSRVAERSVVQQQLSEGQILAPTDGRVLRVPVTVGAVLLAGEPVATIAEGNFVLRLRVPERHARFLKVGDQIRLDGEDIGQSGPRFGTISLVYPQLEDGRVVADAMVENLGDYFVGERIRIWISAGERSAIIVPARFVATRFGVDYVRVRRNEQTVIDVPVQRGRALPRTDMPDGLEILSGLTAGDRLEQP